MQQEQESKLAIVLFLTPLALVTIAWIATLFYGAVWLVGLFVADPTEATRQLHSMEPPAAHHGASAPDDALEWPKQI